VVVLDEATAEAGSAGARELDEAAAALIGGRTAIVVAHRLTQARACDRIAVLADGEITQPGTHEELVARGTITRSCGRPGHAPRAEVQRARPGARAAVNLRGPARWAAP
jgi:ABC-type multidrug transport system fused ATPase/permease subunit